MTIKSITKSSCGPKSKKNIELANKLNKFAIKYMQIINEDTITEKNINNYKFNACNLSYVLRSLADQMRISYLNNIQMNFFKYLRQYVNQSFKNKHEELIKKCQKGKSILRKKLKRELNEIKNDLINNTLTCDKKYHKWVINNKKLILPKEYKKSYESDIKYYPYKYLQYMLIINKFLEKKELKMFQPISLATNSSDNYVIINTNALIDILPNLKNKNKFLKNVQYHQKDIWNMLINIDKSKLRIKNYSFNYLISTDGCAVSINYINNSEIKKKQNRNKNKLLASKKAKIEYKDKTNEEIENIKKQKKEETIKKKIIANEKYKEQLKKKKEIFKKLPKIEQEKIKLQKKIDNSEFNYIGDLIKCTTFLEFIKKENKDKKLVYGDPGKRSIVTFLGDNEKIYNYRSRRRIKETKRKKYNTLIDNMKSKIFLESKKTIKNIETELSKFSKRTTNSKIFKKYIKIKSKMRNQIIDGKIYDNYLKKLKWFSYINKRRHEDRIMNELKGIYGKDAIFILGDWSGKGKISYISTPNIGFKRKLAQHFYVYHIDEHKTSIIHHKTKQKCENLYLPIKNKKTKKVSTQKIHSVLTYKMSNKRLGCINRDVNAATNMKNIVASLMTKGKRPNEFIREPKNPANPLNINKLLKASIARELRIRDKNKITTKKYKKIIKKYNEFKVLIGIQKIKTKIKQKTKKVKPFII